MQAPSTIDILCDTSEKKCLEFPKTLTWHDSCGRGHLVRLCVRREALPTADYTLAPHGGRRFEDESGRPLVLLERKGSLIELMGNLCTKDRQRQRRMFDRLASETDHPILLLDFPVSLSGTGPRGVVRSPSEVVDRLFAEVGPRGISLLWVPPGRTERGGRATRTGEIAVRLMWQIIYQHKLFEEHNQWQRELAQLESRESALPRRSRASSRTKGKPRRTGASRSSTPK